MQEPPDAPTPPPMTGLHQPPPPPRLAAIEGVALVLTLIWLAGSAAVVLLSDPDPGEAGGAGARLQIAMGVLAVVLPLALIWVTALMARGLQSIREQGARLEAAVDALRRAGIEQARRAAPAPEPSLQGQLDEIAAAQRKTETALATFTTVRQPPSPSPPPATAATAAATAADAAPRAPAGDDQVALPLGTPAESLHPPPARADYIRALNFPDTAEDRAGFAALRRALRDRSTAQLVQAAQDVLTLLSEDGLYMDDLPPDMARPEIWRRFAAGERGRAVAALGGIRDRTALTMAAARMKQDTIFRDAAHHFLRLFDRGFTEFCQNASDAEIAALSDTRSARAFMLLGRVMGTFD